jgi:hypothetical protein
MAQPSFQENALRKLVFIDFEASGLGQDSWPIEIGCAWISEVGLVEKFQIPR